MSGPFRNQGGRDSERQHVPMSAHFNWRLLHPPPWFLCWNGHGPSLDNILSVRALMSNAELLSCPLGEDKGKGEGLGGGL